MQARRQGRSLFLVALWLASIFTAVANAAPRVKVLFIHGAAGSEDGGDPELLQLLTGELGCTVEKRRDLAEANAVDDAGRFDLVYISASVFSGNVAGKYREHAMPVLVSEGLSYPDKWMALAKRSRSEKKGPHLATLRITADAAAHPLAAGFPAGPVNVSAGKVAIWSWGAELGAGAKVIAVATATPTDGATTADEAVVEMVYEKGALLTDGTPARGLRIGITWIDSERASADGPPRCLTAEAQSLIRAAVDYATHHR